MRNSFRTLGIALAIVVGSVGSVAARQYFDDMFNQPNVKPQEGTPRTLPQGSVPYGGGRVRVDLMRDQLWPTLPANPVTADAASVTRGQVLFGKFCAACHGPTGAADGPVAAKGVTPFWHLGSPMTQDRPDQYIFAQIWVGGYVMGPFWMMLEERDAWDLVNYVRHLKTFYE
jgi:mono/diheme cytochrome c family protein